MCYRSGTDGRCCIGAPAPADISSSLTRWQHFVEWNDVMVAVLKVWRQFQNPTPSIEAYYSKNIPAKFHPDPIWNDGALVVPTRIRTRWVVPDLKLVFCSNINFFWRYTPAEGSTIQFIAMFLSRSLTQVSRTFVCGHNITKINSTVLLL